MHPIENIMQTSMEQIKRMVDVNTVIGDPIATGENTVLLPVSKVSLGFIVGGGEYGSTSGTKRNDRDASPGGHFPFAGESTVGMSLRPMAFVTVEQGNVRVLPAAPVCLADRFADIIPQMLKSLDRLTTAVIDNLTKKCENSDNENCCGESENPRGYCEEGACCAGEDYGPEEAE
ncbi:MAG: GerW family sporulation protein [Clostridia bacterium]|nr:GerW family sporulation protein [Clostridia bacterium]